MVYRMVYVSAATAPLDADALLALLTRARDKNQRLGITGLLLYRDGDFIQLLEGEREAVRGLFHTIERDPRHTRTLVLLEGEAEQRLFPDWSMGFRNLSDPAVRATPGFSHLMNTPSWPTAFQHDPDGCLALLALFQPPV